MLESVPVFAACVEFQHVAQFRALYNKSVPAHQKIMQPIENYDSASQQKNNVDSFLCFLPPRRCFFFFQTWWKSPLSPFSAWYKQSCIFIFAHRSHNCFLQKNVSNPLNMHLVETTRHKTKLPWEVCFFRHHCNVWGLPFWLPFMERKGGPAWKRKGN